MWLSWLNHLLYGPNSFTKFHVTRYCSHPLMLLFLASVFSGVFCDSFTTVPLGSEISASEGDNNTWVSKNGIFKLGFLEIDSDDGYVVGVNYNLGGDRFSNIPIWTVGLKVSSNSTFMLSMDGRLILMDNLSKTPMWSSNTSNLGVKKACLLDTGNFVLLGSKDEVLWESFDSPSNTLLPGQSLRRPQNLRALSTSSISSYYSLLISESGELKLMWEHNVTYWRSHYESREARFDSNGVFGLYDGIHEKPVWSIRSKDYGDPLVTLRHLRIDRDGNLRIYSWDHIGLEWKSVWQAVEDQCSVFGSCGLYSVCGYNSSGPLCNCLNPSSLETECGGMMGLENCKTHTSISAMNQTVLYGLYPSYDVQMFLSETNCREFCLNETSCIAATSMNDGTGLCTIKQTSFLSGYKTPYIRAVSFLKVCSVPEAAAAARIDNQAKPEPNKRWSLNKFIGALVVIALLTVSVILSIQFLVFSILHHKRKLMAQTRIPLWKDATMNPHYSVLVRLSFEEIKELTNGFSDQIGTSVFRGELPNKSMIVAKVLKDVTVSEKEFRVTVSTLSGTHHRNLASVKGFCFEEKNKFLLYEYVPNGSLDKWLLGSSKGKNRERRIWQQKLDIAIGVARGLSYLHSECQKCIAHGNLKLENVLLDEGCVPKLTDFGLGDLCGKQVSSSLSSESASERDIYALGEMFLQILTGEREVLGERMGRTVEWVNGEGRVDLDGESLEAVERIGRIAFWCMQSQPFLRPSTGEVVKVLEGTLSVDRPPEGLVDRRRHDEATDETSEIEVEVES